MGAFNSLATLGLNAALSQQAQRSQSNDLRKQQERQLREIQLRDAEERRQQDQVLKRRVAQERARAGGAGVGSTGGSADAIVRGLNEEARATNQTRAQLLNLRLDELRDGYAQSRKRNLLETADRLLSLGRSTGRSLLG